MTDHGHRRNPPAGTTEPSPTGAQEHAHTHRHDAPVHDERAPVRDDRVVHDDRRGHRGTGVGRLLGGVAKAGLWMVLGVIVAIVILLALLF